MNRPEGNPKAEGRKKVEIRNPKSECDFGAPGAGIISKSGWLREEPSTEALLLRENSSTRLQPLGERTGQFGEAIILFAKRIPKNSVTDRLIPQLVGAGTSIGANYCEADDSVSGKEFKLRIGICRKESKETMFFLRMVASAEPSLAGRSQNIMARGQRAELNLWRYLEKIARE